jgi:hypothetical protein
MFGWKIDEPLLITLEVDELKLLNSINENELPQMGFKQMWLRSAIKYNCLNDSSNKSYGC